MTPPDSPASPARRGATRALPPAVASRLAALLLGVASVAWAATPLPGTGLAGIALAIAIVAVAGGALRLAFTEAAVPEDQYYLSGPVRTWVSFLAVLRTVPWEEVATIAVIWLEVQHPVRPWHTAALGAALTGYLLAAHIAESGAEAVPLLRRQARALAAGACLLALGAGFAALPAAAPGPGAAILRVLAAIAVIAATALVLPG